MMYDCLVRTTINLDSDVTAAIENLRREEGLGISEAVNLLARRGLAMPSPTTTAPFVQRTHPSGFLVNIDKTGDVLDLLDELDSRGQ
jgi:hypothetical protein